jgi:hypothetical protein
MQFVKSFYFRSFINADMLFWSITRPMITLTDVCFYHKAINLTDSVAKQIGKVSLCNKICEINLFHIFSSHKTSVYLVFSRKFRHIKNIYNFYTMVWYTFNSCCKNSSFNPFLLCVIFMRCGCFKQDFISSYCPREFCLKHVRKLVCSLCP